MVLVRFTGMIPEGIGRQVFETGDTGWIAYETALQMAHCFEILEYEQAHVDTLANREPFGEPCDLPGFVCMECWEQGKLTVYPKMVQLKGHTGSHNPNHGWPKGRPRKPVEPKKGGRPKGTTKEVMEKRRKQEARRKQRAQGAK